MSSKEAITEFMEKEFPQSSVIILEVSRMGAKIKQKIGFNELRPGGTVSGPVMMTVADAAMYVAILGEIGLVALAVTTSLTINFLRKPSPTRDLIAQCELLKVGKSLAVGEVHLYSEGIGEPVAHVVATYSIPPRNSAK